MRFSSFITAAAVPCVSVSVLSPVSVSASQTPEVLHTVSAAGASASKDTAPAGRSSRAVRASRARESLVRTALRHVGDQYVAGASGPHTFDCSGFTMFVYSSAANRGLPHYSGAQFRRGRAVPASRLVPGDLLFYGPGGSQHVSMYIGKGRMVHATNPRTDVRVDRVSNPYWRARFAGARRIVFPRTS